MTAVQGTSNLLELLGVAGREDVVTNLLAHCYNHSAAFRAWFLRTIGIEGIDEIAVGRAYTRVQMGDAGVPDLVIVDYDGSGCSVVVIENKLAAEEGKDQTERYASTDCLESLATRFKLGGKELKPKYVFLTLFPDVQPGSKKFVRVTYESFLQANDATSHGDGPWVPEIFGAWLDILSRFYKAGHLDSDERLLDRLRQSHALDGSFLAFQTFMQSVPCPDGVSHVWSSRSSQRGRRFYLAQFSKPSWNPARMERSGEKWRLNPANCFNIHVEPQFYVLSGEFSLFLHYETSPYLPENEASKHMAPEDFVGYVKRRDQFKSIFRRVTPWVLSKGGTWNQIAKATPSLEGLSVEECRRQLTEKLAEIAPVVDRCLQEMNDLNVGG